MDSETIKLKRNSDDDYPEFISESEAGSQVIDDGDSEDHIDDLDQETFRQKFPLEHIKRIVETKMTNTLPDHLDSQADVINLFTLVYVIRDYSYCDRIDSIHIQIMDPFYRQRVREHNRHAEELVLTYFSSNADQFELSNFIFSLLEKYAQSASVNFGELVTETSFFFLESYFAINLKKIYRFQKILLNKKLEYR
jgi:hypothetical protein